MLLSRKCLSVITIAAVLSLSGSAFAATPKCPRECQEYVTATIAGQARAYNAFLEAEWFGALIAQTPQAICVRSKESDSAGGYVAQNSISTASGAYQFLDTTADSVSRSTGQYDLVGVPAKYWPAYRQDLAFGWLWNATRGQAWEGDGCGSQPL